MNHSELKEFINNKPGPISGGDYSLVWDYYRTSSDKTLLAIIGNPYSPIRTSKQKFDKLLYEVCTTILRGRGYTII